MSATHHLPERLALGSRDTSERLSPDDMATLRDKQFLQAAQLRQQEAALLAPKSTPGVCTNCDATCHPLGIYCDDDCRDDHQHRLAVRSKQNGRR